MEKQNAHSNLIPQDFGSKVDVWIHSHHPTLIVNLLGAKSDLEAVMNWLEEFKHSKHTYRAYEKESLRFLYWLGVEHKIPLSDVRKNHIHQYRTLLCVFL